MTEIFLKILDMSISAGWMILAVLVLRLILRKAPKAFRCILWCLVGLRLVLPFSVESAFSLIPNRTVIDRETLYAREPLIKTGIEMVDRMTEDTVFMESITPNPGDSVNPLQVFAAVGTVVWAVGMAVLLLYAIFSYFRLRKRVTGAIRLQKNIYQSEAVASPFILGVIRPCIYIPFSLKDEELQCVLAHEQAHLRRGDHLWKPMGFLLLTVYWFQPLVWIGYILLCRDIELACDEKVMKQMGPDKKKLYSEILLNCSISHKGITACPLAFGEVGVKQRIKNVLSYQKPAFWIVVVSLIACVVCVVCFMTEPKAEPAEADTPFSVVEPEILQSPPVLNLQDTLSAKWEDITVKDAGTYSWYYKDGDSVTAGLADGPTLQDAVKNTVPILLVNYNQLDHVPYAFRFSVQPDALVINEYDLDMDAESMVVMEYVENYDAIPLKAGRVYEVIAVWAEDNFEERGCHGNAYYVFATENEAVELKMNQEMSEVIPLDEPFTEAVNHFDGVTMNMEKYEPNQGVVEIYNGRDKEIRYGEYFDIQVLHEEQWYSLQVPEGIAYKTLAYGVEPGESREWEVNWEYVYGKLPAGKYRMVKDVMDYREPGDFDKYYLAAEFEIQ